jgi:hypothetical protein
MTMLTEIETPGTTDEAWAFTYAVNCSLSPRRKGRTSIDDMSELPRDRCNREDAGGRYQRGTGERLPQ